jgi:hypothetical protein
MAGWWRRGAALVLVAAVTLTACSQDSSSTPTSAPAGAQPTASPSSTAIDPSLGEESGAPDAVTLRAGTEWEGRFTIAIEVWDYCTTFERLSRSARYTRAESFSFTTAAPVDYGPAARETNPFFISAGTDPDDGGPVGLALQSTGVIALPGQASEPYVLQFWKTAYDDGHLTGELVEDGLEMGLGFNGFQDNDTVITCQPHQGMIVRPYPMKEGSRLEAEFTDESVSVVIEGHSHDEMRRWRVEATATRVA